MRKQSGRKDKVKRQKQSLEKLVEETCGMFKGGPSLFDLLQEERRKGDEAFLKKVNSRRGLR